jgi:hypothetical protein
MIRLLILSNQLILYLKSDQKINKNNIEKVTTPSRSNEIIGKICFLGHL